MRYATRWSILTMLAVAVGLGALACTKSPTGPSPDGTQIILSNAAAVNVVSAGASECSDMSEWPNNLTAPLQPGQEKTLQVYAGCWNLEAKFADGAQKIVWNVTLTKGQQYRWSITK